MTTQNPDLVRVQDVPNSYLILTKDIEISWLRNKYNIKQQFNYLFYKTQDNEVVSIYGSYGHSDVSEVYHVMGERIA